MMKYFSLALSAFASFQLTDAQSDPLLIQTTLGAVKGKYITEDGDQARVWGSIPYAASTAGANRFLPPQPRTPWNDTLTTTNYGLPATACYQPAGLIYSRTEDCLIVNVAAPYTPSDNLLPVMVWIHGGSLRNGAAGLYSGVPLVVEQNIVFVAVNYRLGFLGYIGLDAVEKDEDSKGTFGNVGFLDQVMAMKWVQDNIQNFGGDPNLVTIFGESAGGTSVGALLTSAVSISDTKPLFHRAIIESGQSSFAWTRAQSSILTQHQLTQMNECQGETGSALVSCLRALPAESFTTTPLGVKLNFALTIDGNVIEDVTSNRIAQGKWQNVPLLQGTNHDEMSLFLCESFPSNYSSITVDDLTSYLLKTTANLSLVQQVIAQYPPTDYENSQWIAAVALNTDSVFRCPARNNVVAASSTSSTPRSVFVYSFNYVPGFATACQRVEHSIELPFIFPSTLAGYMPFYSMTQDEQTLAKKMRETWATFAKTGNATTDSINFPPFCDSTSSCAENIVDIISPAAGLSTIENGLRDKQCKFYSDNAQAIADSFVIDPTA